MIEFDGVTFVHQNGFKALDDIKLTIGDSETIAIVGENGAGKTTLVRHINGLLKPTKGMVRIDGLNTKESSTASLSRKVGIAFQNPDHQLFSETVEEEIRFGLRNFGFEEELIHKRIEWAVSLFALEEYRHSSPLVLSGGEKKRLTLACILAWNPDIVILDEPTVGQDAIQKEKLREIIKMLGLTKKTIILVSHDVEFIWPLQSRLVIMARSRVVGDGPAGEIMKNVELLQSARVSQPALLKFYGGLKRRPDSPFADVWEARDWIVEQVKS
jgi:energy-coupling factor transport system ATP-binding protein